MKKLLLSIFLLAAIYTGAWYFFGAQFIDKIEARIEKQNNSPDIQYKIEYSNAKLKGFPLNFEAELIDSEFIPKTEKELPIFSEKIIGNLSVGSNLTVSKVWVSMIGENNLNLILGNSNSPFPVQLHVKNPRLSFNPDNLNDLTTIPTFENALKKDFDITFEFEGFSLKEVQTGYQHKLDIAKGKFQLSNKAINQTINDLTINCSIDKLEASNKNYTTPTKDEQSLHALFNINVPTLATQEKSSAQITADVHIEQLEDLSGLNNLCVKFSSSQNTNKGKDLEANIFIDYELDSQGSHFLKTNAFVKSHNPRELLKVNIENIENNLPSIEEDCLPFTQFPLISKGQPPLKSQYQAMQEVFSYAYENFGEDFKGQVEMDFALEAHESSPPTIKLDIHNYSAHIAPYDFKFNLNVDGAIDLMNPIQHLEGTFFLSEYQDFIKHGANVFNIMVENHFFENKEHPTSFAEEISTKGIDAFTGFLREISNNPNDRDLKVSLEGKDNAYKIGSKQLEEVLMLWMQAFPPQM